MVGKVEGRRKVWNRDRETLYAEDVAHSRLSDLRSFQADSQEGGSRAERAKKV